MRSIKIDPVKACLGKKKQEDISKIAKEKRAGGMVQVTEHLPSKYKNPEFKPQYCQPLPQPKTKKLLYKDT
jgi:hypothetical protein